MLETITRTTKNKKGKTVGRGGTRGKTAGRGTKGQKSRSGHRIRPHIRDIIKKLPKLRGRGKNINKAFRAKAVAVNLARIEAVFETGARITPATLLAKNIVRRSKGTLPMVKILASGELTKKFTFNDCSVSPAAKSKIEAAGGMVQ